MPNGRISNKIYYNGIVFDSGFELEVYKAISAKYSKVLVHNKKILCQKPSKIIYNLDFETTDFYCEAKGNWIFESSHSINEVKLKSNWFVNQYPDKPFYLVFNSIKKNPFKGLNVFTLSQFKELLSNG